MVALRAVSNDNHYSEQSLPSPTIPTTVEGIRLAADAFLTSGWTLAATVWAWTYKAKPGPGSVDKSTELYSLTEFAYLGIRGLKSKDSVIKYRAIWQSAIDAGLATSVEPGEPFEIPDTPFGLITADEPDDSERLETNSERLGASQTKTSSSGKKRLEPEDDDSESEWTPGDPRFDRFRAKDPARFEMGIERQKITESIWKIREVSEKYANDESREWAVAFLSTAINEMQALIERLKR